MAEASSPVRPWASWTVATPHSPSAAMTAGSARSTFADDDAHHSSSTQRGNTAWKPSAYLQSRPPAMPPELRRKWLPRFSATLV